MKNEVPIAIYVATGTVMTRPRLGSAGGGTEMPQLLEPTSSPSAAALAWGKSSSASPIT